MSVNIDDTDPAIQYTGSWQVLMNSPLEFGGGVHSTTQTGASATITFVGTRIQLFCTVPMNSGTETADFTFDGHTGPPLSRESHPDTTYYKDGWFDSGPLDNTVHVLTVSNGGGPSDAPLQLDYFSIAGSVVSPTPAAAANPNPPNPSPSPTQGEKTTTVTAAALVPSITTATTSNDGTSSGSTSSRLSSSPSSSSSSTSHTTFSSSSHVSDSSTSSTTREGPTIISVQYITSTAADGSVTTSSVNAQEGALHSSSKNSVGAVVGGVIGGIIFLLLLLLFLLYRRRRAGRMPIHDDFERSLNPRDPATAIPFRLDINNSFASDSVAGSREMEQVNTKLAPSRYISSPTSPMGSASEYPATSTVSNNAGPSSNEKDETLLSSPSTNQFPSASPFLDPNLLPEEDAGPFRPPPSYQSARGSRQ